LRADDDRELHGYLAEERVDALRFEVARFDADFAQDAAVEGMHIRWVQTRASRLVAVSAVAPEERLGHLAPRGVVRAEEEDARRFRRHHQQQPGAC
jgi:hypothetical protein